MTTSTLVLPMVATPLCLAAAVLAADTSFWPTYADETATRLVASPSVSTGDTQEKDYAWADVDHDGDVDLVCVRKEPWNTPGRFRNVLFMNEGVAEGHAVDGVLVDRTLELASAATDGGQGLLDATADRDVALVDVNGDGWLDLVTSTTYGQDQPKTISHPRIYINRGESGGSWLGFRYEESRTPTMPIAPNFCGLGYGDVTGDDRPDLYFVDYNNDLEDRIWINDGTGSFTDDSVSRLTLQMRESDFGVHAVIADMNGDGVNDVVKDRGSTTTTPPLRITISYNRPALEGTFDIFDITYNGDPYHVAVADLNGDGRLDVVIDDDTTDRYLLNTGNGPDGRAQFDERHFPPASNSFGGNIVVEDVNQDGHPDVVIADVDVDCCGCDRFMHFWRSEGDVPDVTFAEEHGGVTVAARTGTHDVAVFDVNGDGWHDLVIGTCTGMSVWVAQPQLVLGYPQGVPAGVVTPDTAHVFPVRIDEVAGAVLESGTALLHFSVNGAAYATTPLDPTGGEAYDAVLPVVECGDHIEFYVTATIAGGGTITDPPGGATTPYLVAAAHGLETMLSDEIESDVSGWSVENDPSLATGAWVATTPNGTLFGGAPAAPFADATPDPGGARAWITGNGPVDGEPGVADVDGGPTRLITPPLDLAGGDAFVSYARWFFTASGVPDTLTVDVSANGADWAPALGQSTSGTGSVWETATLFVGAHVTPSAGVQLRFTANDSPNDSLTEAGIDSLRVDRLVCLPCATDVSGNGVTDVDDLVALIVAWGPCRDCPADINGDGVVDVNDLVAVVVAWGPC